MKIKVVSDNCACCMQTYNTVKQAAAELDPSISVELVDDIQEILKLGIIQMPTVIINDKIVTHGEHLNITQAKFLIATTKTK